MAEQEDNSRTEAVALRHRFHRLISELETSSQSRLDASSNFCQDFCQVLMDHVRQWRSDEDRLPLLQMYIVAIVCYAEASPSLCPECEHVADVLEKLSWSCLDLLLSFSEQIPGALWEEFQSSVKVAHGILQARGSSQLHTLSTLAEENGVWTNITLNSLLSNNMPDVQKVHSFLAREGPELLHMRIKNLIKQKLAREAALLAKACAEFPEFGGKKNFKQIYLVCLCEIKSQQELMQEIKEVDCKDALDMICNLESEEDEKGALSLCTAFFKRQLLHGDVYCAWELTLFWSKLLIRLESEKAFLDQCRLLARLSGSVYHILLLIKVIQAEVEKDGLSVCIEMCIQALKMGLQNSEDCNITIYKTISCLLPLDLEVKRACQLTEFLVKPSVDSYYAVEMLFNQPDQKLEEDNLPILNSLRCELLLALKTKWPFDPEFWDWRTLKRHCLALMSHEATVILSEDKFSDSEENEPQDCDEKQFSHPDLTRSPTYELNGIEAERKRKREMKKLRERGFVSARFRNWQAYMQYCVLCDKEFLGHRIVKHALKHVQDGIFHCPICAKKFETRVILEPHVASHVKQSCRERLAAMNASKKCPGFSKLTPAGSTLQKQQDYSNNPVKCSQGTTLCNKNSHDLNRSTSTTTTSKIRSSSLRQVKPNWDVKRTEDCSCPVTSCQKVFKYFRNLVAHVKAHKNEMEAKHFLEIQNQKALCQYCHRQFVNVTHLNDHLQMHCGEKPYFCIQLGCNCSFSSYAELLTHRKLHAEFQAKCTHPNCERIFNETYLLYDHEAHHYMTFSCKSKNCGKSFYSLSELNLHQKEHAKQDQSVVDEGPHSQRHTPAQTCIVLELSPNQINEISQEPSPVKLKCSEGILDNTSSSTEQNPVSCTAQLSVIDNDSQTGYTSDIQPEDGSKTSHFSQNESSKQLLLESCYVKLEPIPISCDDPIFLNALRSADSVTQTLLKDKKLFSFPWSQLKHSTLKSSFSMTVANGEENTNHMCPLETCTRKYSTSKSLSRHIKNVHSEVFEEWKLLKKYKRIAEISARKFSSAYTPTSSQILQKLTSCSTQTCEKGEEIGQNGCPDSTFLRAPSFFSGHDVMQPSSVKFCTQLESTQSDTSSNQTELMELPISQTWTTASLDNMDSGFSVQNHLLATNLSDNQLTYSYHSDVHLDYTFASGNDSMLTCSVNARTPLSAMNESSKYVSSSLRVLHALNGDHTCDLTQIKSSDDLEYNQMGPNHSNDISVDASLLHNGCLPGQNTSAYFSTLPAEESAISVQLQGNSNQEFNTDCTDTLFSSDIKYMSDVITTHFIEQSKDFSVSAIPLTDEKSPKELLLESTEGLPSDEKMVLSSVETKKTKKVRSSKRTKWPAILKDGKVICCRCYREFSSTKSLGGHLSKRSQCKPVDEIDLTADLPTSFLDFLNDPDISTVQMSLPTNIKHEQNHKSVTYPLAESNFIYSNSLTSMHDTDCSIQNTCLFSQDPPEIIINSTACNPAVPDEDAKSKLESENTGEDGKVIEIERALQRLDIVDILSLDTLVFENSDLHNLSSKTDVSNNNCQTVRDNVEGNEQKTILKPFRCNEDCTYGAMTKEALFKHLCRVHDYSEERINDMKKNPHKLAPYNCHLCSKTFTRTTGLKIHYTNVHHFSKEDMSRLEILCGRKGKKSSVSGDMHSSLITKQGNSFQLEVSKAIKSESSNDREVTNVGTRKRKNPIQDSLTVSSAETCKPVEASQKSLVSRLSARDTKPLQGPSLTTEDHSNESDQTDIVSMQELTSGGNPYPIGPLNTPNKGTKDGTVQLHRKTKTNSIVVVDLQERKKEMLKESEDNIDSGDSSDALSLYRPYRCVHEGCVAAFSIQQNLILHYRAMHQSDKDESTGFIAKDVDETVRKQEYRCQVKECSKVVSKVTSLLKHYLLLHRCTLEKASTLLSGVEVGTFQCDQSKCSAHFTCHLKYIDHIKNHHKAIRVSADGDFESVDLTFKCQCEGCDRVYTTKSNLLRHLMKKHHSTFETMKEKQKNGERDDIQTKKINSSPDPNNGKENIANNKNIKVRKTKNLKREDRAQNHWLTFEKPSLKSIDEASAICNRRFPLQYPCMIKSCDSVMSAEQNILKHYTTHGLTERYVEDQRNCFIFCKKSKEITRPESTPEDFEIDKTDLEEETQKSKVSSLEVYPEIGLQTEMEVLVNDSFTATSIPVVKRKRGRPRKSKCSIKLYQEHKEGHRNCSGDQVKCMLKVSGSTMNSSNYQDDLVGDALKLYRPLEFETSVKFIEDSSTRNSAKRKTRRGDLGSKRQRTFQPSTNIIYENSNVQDRDKQCVVNFRNPLKIESVNNVKIVMYENISTCSDLLLKQLQDMQPLVILKKWLHS